jgi:hypothetical protein
MNKPDCPPSPFVGLVPFREVDAPFFRGRDVERDLIVENLRASRLTLLYGTSGVGKSSVLYAGAAHRLRELARQDLQEYGKPEFAVVTFNAWRDDPIQGLLRSINEAVADSLQVKSLGAVPESGNLALTINAWTERYGIELLIILDQFEEYFQYRPSEQGPGTFADEFPSAVNNADLRAKFLISLRDDALSKLDRFKSQIPNLFDNLLRIRHMTEETATKAIVEPIEVYNERCGFKLAGHGYSIEKPLVEEVIRQVRAGRDASDEAGGVVGIEAPYLQLVMSRLWDRENEENSRVLRKQTLEELKGIKNIVQVYLDNALALLSPEQKGVAFRIFDYLVTPSGTKIAYFKTDLVSQTKFTEAQIGGVLEALNKSRILRPVPSVDRPDEARYEVFHDLLALAILNWRTLYEATSKAEAEQATAAAHLVEAERQRRLAVQARENRRLRLGLTMLALLLLIALAFGFYAWRQRTQAGRASQLAYAREADARQAEVDAKQAEDVAKQAEDEAKKAYEKVSEQKRIADRALSDLTAAQQETKDALEKALAAEKKATEQSRIVTKQIGQINQQIERIRVLKTELELIGNQTTDKDTRARIAAFLKKLQPILDSQRTISTQDANRIASEQRQESTSGRPVKVGDQIQRKLWQNGKTLHFRFIGGTSALQQRIADVAQEWTKTGANISFVFDNSPDAEIRIGFADEGSWSYVGTDALAVPKREPTMDFGILAHVNLSEDEFRRTVLHEFGHVLGFIHEHQSPKANIPWNKEAVYKKLSEIGWSREMVNSIFLKPEKGDYRDFDRDSIMMITTIPKEWLRDEGFQPILTLATQLSESDKQFVRTLYPRP